MSTSSELLAEAENHVGQKKEVLLAAAAIMRETEEHDELYREVERALETLDWWYSIKTTARTSLIMNIVNAKGDT